MLLLDGSAWTWINEDEEFGNFTHWAPEQPSGKGECGGLYGYGSNNWRWADEDCQAAHYFICEANL